MKPAHPKPGVPRDSLFAFLIVVGSAAPYLGGLGRDDMRMRPVQIFVLSVLFRLFKLGPLGYHPVNTTLLA